MQNGEGTPLCCCIIRLIPREINCGVRRDFFRSSLSGKWYATLQWYLWLVMISWFKELSNVINYDEFPIGLPQNIVPLFKLVNGTKHLSNIILPSNNVLFIHDQVLLDVINDSASWKNINHLYILCLAWHIISNINTKDENAEIFFVLHLQLTSYLASYGLISFV